MSTVSRAAEELEKVYKVHVPKSNPQNRDNNDTLKWKMKNDNEAVENVEWTQIPKQIYNNSQTKLQ